VVLTLQHTSELPVRLIKNTDLKNIQIAGLLSQRLQVSRSESGAGTKFAFLRVPR